MPLAVPSTLTLDFPDFAADAPLNDRAASAGERLVAQLEQEQSDLATALKRAAGILRPAVAAVLAGAFPDQSGRDLSTLDTALANQVGVKDAAWHYAIATLCEFAREHFGHPCGVPLALVTADVAIAFGSTHFPRYDADRRTTLPFSTQTRSLRAVWDALVAQYGHGRGAALSADRAARAFVWEFLCRGGKLTPPVWRKGGLVLTVSMHSERAYNGNAEYGYSSRTHFGTAMGVLSEMLLLLEHDHEAGMAQGMSRNHSALHGPVDTRARTLLTPALAVVTYQQKIDIELGATLSADLMAYLSPRLDDLTTSRVPGVPDQRD